MKKYYILWGLFGLLAVTACSDNDPVVEVNNGNQTEEELPPLPTEVITGSRAMWVSYDPISASDPNNASGIASALISWRLLKTDPSNVAFDIYKSVDGETEVKLNEEPISNTTSWVDADIDVSKTNVYRVTLANQAETLCDYTFTSEMAEKFYHEIRLNMNVPDASITYSPDDIQLGDLDGDGELEIVVKREPYDGANMGVWFNGTTLLEAYKMDGTFLWRIDLGINIRSGSHYTSYVLYDFDGDGLCEIAFRSSEGTKFADGKIITDANGKVNDYRNRQTDGKGWYSGAAIARDQNDPSTATTCGLIMEGPEYISICRGYDGREITRIDNIPRGGEGSKVSRAKYWGDDFGNRMDRFFIGVAYLDGIPDETTGVRVANPSLIISRGIYKNWQVWALDLKGNELVPRWKFDTADHSSKWLAMCSHCFRVADLDGDGRDEILYGSAAIDDDGSELWCSGNGHGDILHVGKFIKDRSGLQIVASFEESKDYEGQGNGYACQVIDARDGSMITGHGRNLPVDASDVGRCIVADVDPDSPDFEYWSSTQEGMFSCNGTGLVSTTYPTGIANGVMYNVAIYWSGQSTREMYDRTCIVSYKDNPDVNKTNKKRLLSFKDAYGTNDGNHGTKYNPCYYGDFLGDYREEVILGSSDNKSIYIFSTNHPTTHRLPHLMTDHNYDMSQAMQNMGYNQGTNLGYYVGAETLKTSETEEPKE